MPTADNYFLVGIEINCLIGPTSDISKHGDFFSSHWKVGDGSRRANVDSHLTDMDQTGKLPRPTTVFCIEVGGVTIRTSINDINSFGKVFHLLEATNRTENLFLKDAHLRFRFKNGWTEEVPFGIFLNPGISSFENRFCPIFDSSIYLF